MANPVKSPSNHYDTLGITPAASEDEIRHAFERKMSERRWHPMGGTARICIAYETLSNRIKRADYDRLHGLAPKAQPRLQTMTVTQERWAPFIASAPTNPLGQAAREAAAEPHVTAQPDPQLQAAPKRGSLIAASLRELARPAVRAAASGRRSRPKQPRRPSDDLEPQLRQMLADRAAAGRAVLHSDDRLLDWKKPVLTVGGFVIAAGLIGAFAGLSVRGDEGSTQAGAPVLRVSSVTPHTAAAAASVLPVSAGADSNPEPAVRTAEARTRTPVPRHAPSRARTAKAVEGASADPAQETESQDQVAADGSAAQPVDADLPLPSAVVARTIDRIGYSCGQVTSTAAAQAGGFKVTCSSGQTYDATRVRGRYHFRRSH